MEGQLSATRGAPQGAPPRVRLRPTIELFPAGDGDVYLFRPGKPEIVVRAPSAADRALLERLAREPVPRAEAERAAALIEAGAVIAWEEPVADVRFSRQLPYLAEIAGARAQQRLRDSRVTILGCGGLGTWILSALAAAGVGRLMLCDDDTVELSNLNRQTLYRERDIGRAKVEAAADWVRAFDATIEVEIDRRRVRGPEDAAALVEDASLLVLAADWPPYELGRWVNRACVAAGVPFVTAGQQPPLLKAGPTYIPGVTPCFHCHETWLAARAPLYPELAEYRRRHPSEALTLGPASALVGGIVATDAMHLLAGAGPPATAGTAILIDMRTFALEHEAIERFDDCQVCGS